MSQKLTQLQGAGALLLSAFIYGTFGLLIREIAKMMGDATQVAARFILAAGIIALANLLMRKALRIPRVLLLKAGLLGVAFALVVLFFTISANSTKIINSVVLLYGGSIIASFLIGTFIFKEKVTGPKILAIIIALIGLAMFSNAFLALSLGVITGFASGLMDGVANGLRKTLKAADRNVVVMYQFGIGSVFSLLLVLFSGGFVIGEISLIPVLAILVFALLLVFLNNLLLFGFQHFDVNVGTVILATELFFAMVLGYLFLHESPTLSEVVGGALIFFASIIAAVDVRLLFGRLGRGTKNVAAIDRAQEDH
jgi:drug/metabolite transporter (DMT)-like permease